MKPFASRVEMKGWRAGLIAGFGILLLLAAFTFAVGIPHSEKPWIVWLLIGTFSFVGIALIFYAIYCRLRRVEWLLEADDQKIVWHRTDASGGIRGRTEVQVTELSGVTYFKTDDGGASLYLDLRSGGRHRLSGIIPSDADFLSWASENYPSIKVVSK